MKSKITEFFKAHEIPVVPLVGIHTAQVMKIDVQKALADGSLMAEAELRALEYYNYDSVLTFMDLTLEAEALGCKIQYHTGTVPSVKKVLFRDLEKYNLIKSSNIEKRGRVPEFLRAVKIMAECVDHSKTLLGTYVTGPFTLAGQVMGMETILESMILHPEELRKILEKTLEVGIVMTEKLIDEGADYVVILDPMASPDLISPFHFDRFAAPYLRNLVDSTHTGDASLVLHICGDTTNILPKMVECGYDAFSIDSKVNMMYAASVIKDKVLMGNIDPVNILLKGKPADVHRAAEECIESSLESKYFILSSGCEVPKNTPKRNIEEMVKVARGYKKR